MKKQNSATGKSARSKKPVIAAAAVTMALAFSIGGVLAYLQDDSDTVSNIFSQNDKVTVALSETGASKKSEDSATYTKESFRIIPGNSETKDPKVSGTATVPAYVFVKVTDAADGLVNYSIADGWTELESAADADNGVKVYYREFTPAEGDDGAAYSYDVLQGNRVSYPSTIGNKNASSGNDAISLTFKAYAIQKDNIYSPKAAYALASGTTDGDNKTVNIVTDKQQTETMTLNANSTETTVFDGVDFTVDTTGKTSNVYINGGFDGTVIFNNCNFKETDYEYLQATMTGDASIIYTNCNFYVSADAKRVLHVEPSNHNGKLDITITNCNFYTTENITSDTHTSMGAVSDYIDLDYIADGSTLTLGGNKFYTSDGTEITAMSSNPGIYFCSTSAHNYAQTAYATMFGYVTGDVKTYTVTDSAPTADSSSESASTTD